MQFLDEFADIVKHQQPLAPYTYFKLGGPAQALAQPRTRAELIQLVRRARAEGVPAQILGGGCNLLVRDEGVRGLVIRLSEPEFTQVESKGGVVRAAAGATLAATISEAARLGLAGIESLIGIPGSVGGSLKSNTGTKAGTITQMVHSVEVLDAEGEVRSYKRDELPLASRANVLEDAIILSAEFALESDDPNAILKRMRRFWIQKKAQQPLSFQPAGRIFKDPRGLAADQLIEQAGLQGTRVGGAEVSERHANYIVAHPGATARDVLRLIELIRTRVSERFGQMLQLDIVVW